MTELQPYLANLWLSIIALFLLYYAAVDGAVLGVGMFTLINPAAQEREIMIGSLLSTWHSNQTWLVVVGGMMFGAFPLFYGVLLTALYVPVFLMLFGFIIRGVALDYWEAAARKHLWELAFGVGSLLTTLAQGCALGGLLGGMHLEGGRFAGSLMDWATPFSFFMTAGVLLGYLMLGANFLILKMDGGLQQRGYRYALICTSLTFLASIGTYAWLLFRYSHMQMRFTTAPTAYFILPFPILALLGFLALFYSLWKGHEKLPLILNVVVIIFSFTGVSLGLYPLMIPNLISESLTVGKAAAAPQTLIFMLIVIGIAIPLILLYTTYEFWVFRGKAREYYQKKE